MTEKQAKTKWCPMIRMTNDNRDTQFSWNAIWVDSGINHEGKCIASACMMWVETDYMPQPGDDFSKPVRSGHCGLAR